MMRPGPLQEQTQHPRYVDILTRCIRETYIAHMGTFDELEFCVWLVTEVTYHTEQTGSDEVSLSISFVNSTHANYSSLLSFMHYRMTWMN